MLQKLMLYSYNILDSKLYIILSVFSLTVAKFTVHVSLMSSLFLSFIQMYNL